jgi:uncharacterized membrane protein
MEKREGIIRKRDSSDDPLPEQSSPTDSAGASGSDPGLRVKATAIRVGVATRLSGLRPSVDRALVSRIASWLPFLAILLIAAAIRWRHIGDSSLGLDELTQVHVAQSPLGEFLAGVRAHTSAAPLDYVGTRIILDTVGAIVGVGSLSARLWPWFCGVATVFAIERATLELTGSRRTALTAAALTAFSGFLVFYSQEARFYSMSALMTVMIVWTFARAIRLRRRRDWAAFGCAAVAGVYTHYFIALLLVLEGASLMVVEGIRIARRRSVGPAVVEIGRRLLPLVLVGVVTGLAFLPWYLYAARPQLSIVYAYPPIAALSPERLAQVLETLLAATWAGGPGGVSWSDWLLTAAVVALAVPGAARLMRARPETATAMVSMAIVLIPLVWVMDIRSHYFISERQFIFLVPLLYILAAAGLDTAISGLERLAEFARPRASQVVHILAPVGLAVALVGMSILPLRRVYAGDFRPRENWQLASSITEKLLCSGGRVYSNVAASYYYGVVFYAPELEPRAVFLAQHGQNEFLVDVFKRYPIGSSDVIVVYTPAPGVWVPGRGTIGTISDALKRQGFQFQSISADRIRIFYTPAGCQAAAAKTLVVSGMTTPRTSGSKGSIRVTAVDAYGNRAPGYRGTVHFRSTDLQASLPSNYTFTAADAGTHVFVANVTLKTAGTWSVTATDTATASLEGTQSSIVVN